MTDQQAIAALKELHGEDNVHAVVDGLSEAHEEIDRLKLLLRTTKAALRQERALHREPDGRPDEVWHWTRRGERACGNDDRGSASTTVSPHVNCRYCRRLIKVWEVVGQLLAALLERPFDAYIDRLMNDLCDALDGTRESHRAGPAAGPGG